jgi:hypothetical protein
MCRKFDWMAPRSTRATVGRIIYGMHECRNARMHKCSEWERIRSFEHFSIPAFLHSCIRAFVHYD